MENALEVRDVYRAQSRALLIRECQVSELTNKESCRQRGISEKSYYHWLKKHCSPTDVDSNSTYSITMSLTPTNFFAKLETVTELHSCP